MMQIIIDFFRLEKNESSLWKKRVHFGYAFLLLVFLAGMVSFYALIFSSKIAADFPRYRIISAPKRSAAVLEVKDNNQEWRFIPGPISMDEVRSNGCVADGFLSNYGDRPGEITATLNRSNCIYLHRALETWLRAPDFDRARGIMEGVKLDPVVYGMFIAEAIPTSKKYRDLKNGKVYRYEKMCRNGTDGRWGNNTCVPSVGNVEYRKYLKAITRSAMDIGIQSFMFGQIKLQDGNHNFQETEVRDILADMRQYAKEKNMQIIVGAQTNDIIDEEYLRMFDYIEGGVGIDDGGQIEDQPCSSKFSSCWALLWDNVYKSKANNVLLHLDWSGLVWDDMGKFARMTPEVRIKTLKKLYTKFNNGNTGFMMPYLAVLNHQNDGCYGPNKDFYAPSQKFKCKDEDGIRSIMPKT